MDLFTTDCIEPVIPPLIVMVRRGTNVVDLFIKKVSFYCFKDDL